MSLFRLRRTSGTSRPQVALALALVGALVVAAYLRCQSGRESTLSEERVADPIAVVPPSHAADVPVSSPLGREASRVEAPTSAAPDEGTTSSKAEPEPAETWQERYSNFTLGQVIDEARSLRAAIDTVSMPYYQDRFDHHDYEVIGTREPGKPFDVPTDNFDELCTMTFFKDGTVGRVVLPRERFPEAYEMREKVVWLDDREDVLKRKPLTDFKLNVSR